MSGRLTVHDWDIIARTDSIRNRAACVCCVNTSTKTCSLGLFVGRWAGTDAVVDIVEPAILVFRHSGTWWDCTTRLKLIRPVETTSFVRTERT